MILVPKFGTTHAIYKASDATNKGAAMKLPVIKPVDKKTEKVCTCCGQNHDLSKVKAVAVENCGFYWWNCDCKNTLVQKAD